MPTMRFRTASDSDLSENRADLPRIRFRRFRFPMFRDQISIFPKTGPICPEYDFDFSRFRSFQYQIPISPETGPICPESDSHLARNRADLPRIRFRPLQIPISQNQLTIFPKRGANLSRIGFRSVQIRDPSCGRVVFFGGLGVRRGPLYTDARIRWRKVGNESVREAGNAPRVMRAWGAGGLRGQGRAVQAGRHKTGGEDGRTLATFTTRSKKSRGKFASSATTLAAGGRGRPETMKQFGPRKVRRRQRARAAGGFGGQDWDAGGLRGQDRGVEACRHKPSSRPPIL